MNYSLLLLVLLARDSLCIEKHFVTRHFFGDVGSTKYACFLLDFCYLSLVLAGET